MRENVSGWKARFFTIWVGQQLSLIGSRAAQFALVWWLTKETGSATVLATATMVALFPRILLGPLAGAYIDRWNRRAVMFVADSFIALLPLVGVSLLHRCDAGLARLCRRPRPFIGCWVSLAGDGRLDFADGPGEASYARCRAQSDDKWCVDVARTTARGTPASVASTL